MRRRSSWPIPCQAASSYADSAGQELLSMLRPHADAASTSWEAAQHPSLDDELLLRNMEAREDAERAARLITARKTVLMFASPILLLSRYRGMPLTRPQLMGGENLKSTWLSRMHPLCHSGAQL